MLVLARKHLQFIFHMFQIAAYNEKHKNVHLYNMHLLIVEGSFEWFSERQTFSHQGKVFE